jgi:hypothetical protein
MRTFCANSNLNYIVLSTPPIAIDGVLGGFARAGSTDIVRTRTVQIQPNLRRVPHGTKCTVNRKNVKGNL